MDRETYLGDCVHARQERDLIWLRTTAEVKICLGRQALMNLMAFAMGQVPADRLDKMHAVEIDTGPGLDAVVAEMDKGTRRILGETDAEFRHRIIEKGQDARVKDAPYWRTILVKYIEHVAYEEGTDFLVVREEGKWSDDEWDALKHARGDR